MFRLLLKIIWKKGIPIPGGYIMEKVCYTKKEGGASENTSRRKRVQCKQGLSELLMFII